MADNEIIDDVASDVIEPDNIENPSPETEDDILDDLKKVVFDGEAISDDKDDDDIDDTPADAPNWAVEQRKKAKEFKRENTELKRKIKEIERNKQAAASAQNEQENELGERPSLFDFDGDEDEYVKELEIWVEKKAKVESRKQQQAEAEKTRQAEWSKKLSTYNDRKAKAGVDDYEEVEEVVADAIGINGIGLIVDACKNPTAIIYSMKNESRRNEMASLYKKNPIAFAYELGRMESKIGVRDSSESTVSEDQKRTPPPPHKRITSSASSTPKSVQDAAEALRKAGKWSELIKFKREHGL